MPHLPQVSERPGAHLESTDTETCGHPGWSWGPVCDLAAHAAPGSAAAQVSPVGARSSARGPEAIHLVAGTLNGRIKEARSSQRVHPGWLQHVEGAGQPGVPLQPPCSGGQVDLTPANLTIFMGSSWLPGATSRGCRTGWLLPAGHIMVAGAQGSQRRSVAMGEWTGVMASCKLSRGEGDPE